MFGTQFGSWKWIFVFIYKAFEMGHFFELFYSRQVMFECLANIFSKKIEVKRIMRKQNWMILFSLTANFT